MLSVSLELFKKHVRADDFDGDDDYLAHLLRSAEEFVCTETRRTADELCELGGGECPPMLVHAVMMIAGHWYNQREAASGTQMSEVPYSLKALVKPWTKLCDDDSGIS